MDTRLRISRLALARSENGMVTGSLKSKGEHTSCCARKTHKAIGKQFESSSVTKSR